VLSASAALLAGLAVLSFAGRLGAADKSPGTHAQHARLCAFGIDGDKSEHVFYRNHDGEIIELFTKQGDTAGWRANNLTTLAGGPKAASGPDAYYWNDTKSLHVFYRGTDDGLHELYRQENGQWKHNDLTVAGAPKAAGEPAGYVEEGNKTQHVIYRTAEGGLAELYSKQGDAAGWRVRDLTAETKAAKAAGDPDAFYWRDTKSQHVVYRGEDDDVHELYLDPEGHWQSGDLSKTANAPKAVGSPTAYVEEPNKTEHVVFRTDAGDVVELHAKYKENQWAMKDLTKEANAPKAAGDPTAYRLRESRLRGITTQHVVYRGEDGDLHELYLGGPENRWTHNDVTAAAKGAPKAASDPVGYVVEANRTQHLVYRTTDGKVFELYNVPDGADRGWHVNDLSAAAHVPTTGSP
jgi:hypothetical protein